eukprot:NODE_4280_length_289_cov_505.029167_g3609_i0.p2 GENE.NODE_4280_length_289_cov_505.029167_g3609_i0~~NODE_4280_length_289_cov_505.029167_g3609_i0.p2  ORF type:complete len:50 (-),score=0.38 NODE_4280_length_289_cov_505.029167_g3609_i0:57-206(-)
MSVLPGVYLLHASIGSVGMSSSALPAQGTINSELKRTRGIRQFNKNQAL